MRIGLGIGLVSMDGLASSIDVSIGDIGILRPICVVDIEEHEPLGEGDCWHWTITFEDGGTQRFFRGSPGVFRVDYAPEGE